MKRPTIILIAVLAIVFLSVAGLFYRHSMAHVTSPEAVPQPDESPREFVELSDQKLSSAEIETASPTFRELHSHRTVPGRIEYNALRHVALKSPFDGLIRRIDVKIGDRVTDSQVLAVVDSPELGEKRADVLLRQSDLVQTRKQHDWWHNVQGNVDELLARLRRPQDVDRDEKDDTTQLEKDFADKPLGDYRHQILGAYSRMRLDEKLSANLKIPTASGASPARLKLESDSARDTSRARFAAACEQVTFDANQQHVKSEAAMKDAEQRLEIAKQRLALLIGTSANSIPDPDDKTSLSTWHVKAPFAGTVEEILFAPNERIQLGQTLFQLADTSKLWVQADIRERDWSALSIQPGQSISVQTPALPGQTLDATVAFVGRTVSPDTRAVPLTADIDNQSEKLRPGMFVRVLIPEGASRNCLVVPQSAIVNNEERTFVFVKTTDHRFVPRDVKTGMHVDHWVEVQSGLTPDDHVVTRGTIVLKSELLLQSED